MSLDNSISNLIVKFSSLAFDPCNPGSYKVFDAYDRLVGNSDQSSVKCDQQHVALPDWYRFTGEAGDQMPTKCPKTLRCGTHAPGWLSGAHPSVADGVVNREVCYHWSNNCCRWKNNIKVKNCGNFYVYELQKPPACSLRYCGEYYKSPRCSSRYTNKTVPSQIDKQTNCVEEISQ